MFLKSTYPESCSEWEQSLSGCLRSQSEPAGCCCCCLFIVPSEFRVSLHSWSSEIPLRAELIALTANLADGEAQWDWLVFQVLPMPQGFRGQKCHRKCHNHFLRKDALWSSFKECLVEHRLRGLEGFIQVRFSL